MTCRQFHQLVDRLVVGDLPPNEQVKLRAHAANCPDCSEVFAMEHRLNDGLTDQHIPEPSLDFEARVRKLALASQDDAANEGWSKPIWGSAVAAVLALGLFIGVQMNNPESDGPAPGLASTESDSADNGTPVVQAQQKSVRLAFNSKAPMDNVTLTLEMPPHAELSPFPGRQVVSWKVDLKKGDNVLVLPVNVLFPGSGELVAHLDNGSRKKTFTAAIPKLTEPTL